MALAVGDTVARYELLEKLGEGGMGVVFRARDTRLGRDVALKVLPADLAADPIYRERLMREARAAAALEHPVICPVYEFDEADGQVFIAMGVAEGRDLHALMGEGPLGVREAIRIALEVGKGLAVAHAKGILHRDIKPANIMLAADGQVRILDFGLARTAESQHLTTSGTLVGTAAYMSPEQLTGDEADHRADIWALGVVLYEMLTGVLPFRARSPAALMYTVLSSVPEPVAALRADVPMGMEWVLNKALAKKAQDRYQRIEAMCGDLGALMEERTTAGPVKDSGPVGTTASSGPSSRGGSPGGSPAPGNGGEATPLKLLIVDDEPDLELLMRQHFRKRIRAGEFELMFAANGAEALETLERDPGLEIVLTDIRMPVMDGLTFLGELSRLDRFVKAVVISAYGDLGNIRTAMNRGAFDFLMKPIDFGDLEATIAKTSKELSHSREAREVRRRLSAMEQEIDVARRIQAAVVPRSLSTPDWLERYAFVSPARDVGGDFHDLFELAPGEVGISIGEVFGSGVGAAVFAAVNRTLLKALARRRESPAGLMEVVDALLRAEGLNAMSTTALFGILERDSGRFRYCSAGHPHPYVVRSGGEAFRVEGAASPALGAGTTGAYQEAEVVLSPGDSLFLYTDGIPDAANAQRVIFSHEQLGSVLGSVGTVSPAEVVRAVVRAVDDFTGNAHQMDDITAFACRLGAGRRGGSA